MSTQFCLEKNVLQHHYHHLISACVESNGFLKFWKSLTFSLKVSPGFLKQSLEEEPAEFWNSICFFDLLWLTKFDTPLLPILNFLLQSVHLALPFADALASHHLNLAYTPFFYKQSIIEPRPENCLSFSKKSPLKIVQQMFSRWSINFYCLNIQTF